MYTLLAPIDDLAPLPLSLTSLGDHIALGGFRLASELINWDEYYEKGGLSFARQIKNEAAFAPDPEAFKQRPIENFEWPSEEEDPFHEYRIVSFEARIDLLETRKMAVLNRLRHQDAERQDATIDPRLLGNNVDVAGLEKGQDEE